MNQLRLSLTLLALAAMPAWADPVPLSGEGSSAPWAAITIFAVVIGMIAGIAIWRRRR